MIILERKRFHEKRDYQNKNKRDRREYDLVKKHLPSGFEEFFNLRLVKDGIYKKIEFSIENIFDICAIINTDLELGIPRDDENIVENLIKNGVLTKEMGKTLRLMKEFRNILVHRYGKIDDILYSKY